MRGLMPGCAERREDTNHAWQGVPGAGPKRRGDWRFPVGLCTHALTLRRAAKLGQSDTEPYVALTQLYYQVRCLRVCSRADGRAARGHGAGPRVHQARRGAQGTVLVWCRWSCRPCRVGLCLVGTPLRWADTQGCRALYRKLKKLNKFLDDMHAHLDGNR